MSVESSALDVERFAPHRAIFLSYARDDAGAARRIAEALRASGLEVWFDEHELRGGDTWDAKIRKQIDACTLFIPVVSQHTQDRSKGYFRLEWKLAVDQTHLLAEGVPFLAPVVIDETREADAVVPPEFMKVQWTRLPGALPTPQFVEQVKRLLDRKAASVRSTPPMVAGRPRPSVGASLDDASGLQGKNSIPAWTWGALTAVVVGIVVAVSVARKAEPAGTETPTSGPALPSPASSLPSPASPRVAEKSIAVLPFTNMSEEKEANAFFADGVHEDILTNLALLRDLRVISRTSVMEYRGTTKKIPEIARELGVTYVLEGSVRRAGNKVRVTGQLIQASTDGHLWARSYDRDLTDIFTVQAELAQAIAAELKAAISPQEKSLIESRPTQNQAAYDLYVQARSQLNDLIFSSTKGEQVVARLEKAVELDAGFALGWALLSFTHVRTYFWNSDHTHARLAKAKAAIDQAMRLAPDSPQVIRYFGAYHYYGYRDYVRARAEFERAGRLLPNDPEVSSLMGEIDRRQGRWPDALARIRRAVELDPVNSVYLVEYCDLLHSVRRFDEALAIQRRLVTLRPEDPEQGYYLGSAVFSATGSRREMEAFFGRMTPEQFNAPRTIHLRKSWAFASGDFAEAIRLDRLQPYFDEGGASRHRQALWAAIVYEATGDLAGMRARLAGVPEEVRERLQREPNNADLWQRLGQIEALLGNGVEAERCIERAMALLPEALDALKGVDIERSRAFIWVRTGKREQAIAEYARFLTFPANSTVHNLRNGAFWAILRGDPRWEAVLNDPKNHAPLF